MQDCGTAEVIVEIYTNLLTPLKESRISNCILTAAMGSISVREFIRWLPQEASEPTSTIVVTSPERRFVDIRVIRPEGAPENWPTREGMPRY